VTSADLTRYARESDGSFVEYTVKGLILPEGAKNAGGITLPNLAKWAKTLYTSDVILEGDRIEDADTVLYDVHQVEPYFVADQFEYYLCELVELREVTLKTRTSATAYTYTEKDIYMNVAVRGQSSINPQEYFGFSDYIGVTDSDVYEGDQIEDQSGNTYEVMQVTSYPSSRFDFVFNWKAAVLVKQFPSVTLRTLTLGTADATTGIPASSYAESTIYMSIMSPSKSRSYTPAGYYGKVEYVGLTATGVLEGDQIEDGNGDLYEVTQVTRYPTARADLAFRWTVCGLIKRDYDQIPADTATWHKDVDAVSTDPRNRLKTLMDLYITPKTYTATSNGNVGGTTIINTAHTQTDDFWNGYLVEMLTGTCAGELRLISDFAAATDTLTTAAFTAQIDSADTYTIYSVMADDQAAGADIRVCFDDAPYPILRCFSASYEDLNALAVLKLADSKPLYSHDLNVYGFEETVEINLYAVNKTNYTAQNLLEQYEQAIRNMLTEYNVTSASIRDIQSAKYDNIDLSYAKIYHTVVKVTYKRWNTDYTNSGVTVTYADNQGSTYTFPNVTEIHLNDPDSGDNNIAIPGRIGRYPQIMYMDDFEVTVTSDLDVSPTACTWLRPQTTTPKTDTVPFQVFSEIKFGNKYDSDQKYQNLNWAGTAVAVRLVDIDMRKTDAGQFLTVTFRRYSATAGSAYKTWYGIT
jgi:hypothetical protein